MHLCYHHAAFIGAALAEIAGCYAFWAYMRLGKSLLWLLPGTLSLWLFATLLTLVESDLPDALTPSMALFISRLPWGGWDLWKAICQIDGM